jgi:hypothetical protein
MRGLSEINVRVMRRYMYCESCIIRMLTPRSNGRGNGIVFYNGKKMKAFYSKITLYVVRVGRNNEWYDSSPCEQCARMIKTLNIKKIVFTNRDGKLEKHNPQNYTNNFMTLGNRAIEQNRFKVSIQHNFEAKLRRVELLAKYHN